MQNKKDSIKIILFCLNFAMVPCCGKPTTTAKQSSQEVPTQPSQENQRDTQYQTQLYCNERHSRWIQLQRNFPHALYQNDEGSHLISKATMHYRKQRWKVKRDPVGHLGSFFVICDRIVTSSNILEEHNHFCQIKKIWLQKNSNFKPWFWI